MRVGFAGKTGRCLCKRSLLGGLSELGLPDLHYVRMRGWQRVNGGIGGNGAGTAVRSRSFRGSFTLFGLFFVTFRLDMKLPCRNLVIW